MNFAVKVLPNKKRNKVKTKREQSANKKCFGRWFG